MMKISILKKTLLLGFSAVLMVLGGCASVPDVRVSMDRTTDFTKYKTFGFISPLGTDRSGYQSIVSQELKLNTQREMEIRGMRLVTEAPQLLINFSASMEDKTSVHTVPVIVGMDPGYGNFGNFGWYGFNSYNGYNGFNGYYGYRTGLYSPWPLYVDQTVVTQYKEGTLNIDIVDAARKQLVWEGVVKDTVTQKDLQNLAKSINTAITAAFAKYPIAPPAAPKTPATLMTPTTTSMPVKAN